MNTDEEQYSRYRRLILSINQGGHYPTIRIQFSQEEVNLFLAADAELSRLRGRFTTPIVCICGSTRFKQAWIAENARLTGEGNIVLAVGLWGHHERVYPDEKTKAMLDSLHLRKIDLCDWVWVLDIGGYIGESTRNEIAYADARGKIVRYLSKEFPDYVESEDPLTRLREENRALYDAYTIQLKLKESAEIQVDTLCKALNESIRRAGKEG